MTPLGAFTADVASRLTGISQDQLERWDREGFFTPAFADPNRRRAYSRIYSFQDLVGLRTIALMLRRGVSLRELKKIREFFAASTNEEWAIRRFYVVGPRVFMRHGDAVVAARPLGQTVAPEIVELEPIVDEMTTAVRRLGERTPDQIGQIVRERFIMNGAPVIAGTRIPTATIYDLHEDGYDLDQIIAEFPRLQPADVERAIAFERERRRSKAAG